MTNNSPAERARAIGPLLEQEGPEIDRRRELTPAVVDALVEHDLLRLLLPKGLSGQEITLLEFCKTTEALAINDASTGWFVNQSNISAASAAASMPPEPAPDATSTFTIKTGSAPSFLAASAAACAVFAEFACIW